MATTHRRSGTGDRVLGLVLLLALVAAAAASTEEEGPQGNFSLQFVCPESYGQNNNRRRLGTDQRPVYSPQHSRQQQEACTDNYVEEASIVRLKFICNTLKTPIYTHKTISACDGQPVEVGLYKDGHMIESGPLCSLNVEIVALPGDFWPEDNSTAEDFDRQIVISRKGQTVLEGCCLRTLLNGRQSFDGIRFKEGSTYTTSTRQFTLAARVVRGQDTGGLRVHEAFMLPAVNVKDRRSEANEKSDPPKLNDEVYRLNGIAKGGRYFQRLQKVSIVTVQDFLKAYNTNPERLRNILEIKSAKNNNWKEMTEHALDCDLEDMQKLKKYTNAGENAALFFNCVHDLVGAELQGHYVAKEEFAGYQKAFVERQKERAYQAYDELEGIELDYVMKDGRPINISTSINVVDLSPFLMMQDAIPQPNRPDQHATYQGVHNSGPAENNQHMSQTLPENANCNIAALVPGAGGSEPFLPDHHRACVNEDWAPTCSHYSMRASAAWEDGPSSSAFCSPDMMARGTWANEVFRASDFMNQPMFTPSPPYGVPGSGLDNFYFYGNNELFEASTSTQNNLLSYQPGFDYDPCWETESQADGMLHVDSIPPYISIRARTTFLR